MCLRPIIKKPRVAGSPCHKLNGGYITVKKEHKFLGLVLGEKITFISH